MSKKKRLSSRYFFLKIGLEINDPILLWPCFSWFICTSQIAISDVDWVMKGRAKFNAHVSDSIAIQLNSRVPWHNFIQLVSWSKLSTKTREKLKLAPLLAWWWGNTKLRDMKRRKFLGVATDLSNPISCQEALSWRSQLLSILKFSFGLFQTI